MATCFAVPCISDNVVDRPNIVLQNPFGEKMTLKVGREATSNDSPTYHELCKRMGYVNSPYLLHPHRASHNLQSAASIPMEFHEDSWDDDEEFIQYDDVEDKEYEALVSELEKFSTQVFAATSMATDHLPLALSSEDDISVFVIGSDESDGTDDGNHADSETDTACPDDFMETDVEELDTDDVIAEVEEKNRSIDAELASPVITVHSKSAPLPISESVLQARRLVRFQSYSEDADDEDDEVRGRTRARASRLVNFREAMENHISYGTRF